MAQGHITIFLFGSGGRMGRAIAGLAGTRDDIAIGEDADAFIDFSAPAVLGPNLDAALAAGKPIVIGTTGLTPDHKALIERAATRIPIVQSANMSLGVNLLAHLVRTAAARLGPEWDIEIAEMHHRHKVDAPSGTALLLGAAAAEGRGVDLTEARDSGERLGARREGAIGFASLRGGSVAGDHEVVFAGEGERLELGHRAESREVFARGALQAARWAIGKPPGLYGMTDVLGLT